MNSSAKVLAITVLLLGLTAQLAAQSSGKAQTLESIRDIEVVVKYGHVDGQQEEWQPILLQRLEDRARQRLWEAGIPLSQDKAGTSRPRLVFTITLNRVSTTVARVRVDVQVHQRVRLWRDAAKELELATWGQSGFGYPTVTEKMVSDVFDGQVAEFLKAYREVNQTSSQVPTQTRGATPAQLSDTSNTFEGLNGTSVFVSIRRDLFFDRPPVDDKFLQEAVETRLKQAGIKITRYTNETEQTGHANLSMWVKLSPPNVQTFAPPIDIESTFSQWVRLVRDPKMYTNAVTWKSEGSGDFAKTDNGSLVITNEAVLEVVNRQLDEFIKVFKAASPPPQKAQNTTAPE